MTTIANMTFEELRKLIDETVDSRIERLLGVFEENEDDDEKRPLEEVLASIERNRWTPPPGTPSVTDLLREDRDRY